MDTVPKTSGLRRYEPAVAVRFGWWFGIYLLSWVFLVWCWHGELSNWFSPLLVPAGLIDLSYAITRYLRFPFNCDGKALFYLARSIYAAHLALSLIVRSRNAFWILMAICS